MTGLAQGHGWFVAERAWDPRGADGWGLPRAKVGPGLAVRGYVTPAGTAPAPALRSKGRLLSSLDLLGHGPDPSTRTASQGTSHRWLPACKKDGPLAHSLPPFPPAPRKAFTGEAGSSGSRCSESQLQPGPAHLLLLEALSLRGGRKCHSVTVVTAPSCSRVGARFLEGPQRLRGAQETHMKTVFWARCSGRLATPQSWEVWP